uniref:Uncharacterized protein n=1 Tax=viral metagenome TaxID=1070528 RepID=A0A6M3KZF5_9ZZZZ
MINPRPPALSPPLDEGRRACVLCGPFYHEVEMRFDSGGTAEPTVGETFTGASSGDTGVVDEVVLESGTYAGGDAVGTICLTSPTGVGAEGDSSSQYNYGSWGTDNETITGSTGGADMMTLNGTGARKSYGRLWPETQLYFRDGKYYCSEHYMFRFRMKTLDETPLFIPDRGSVT